jgi:ABC-2 type transport system ATP-binding protein
MSSVVVTEGLTRAFGANVAVDGLDLAIEQGAVFGFLGHNGAGKTTTVRLLNGVLTPTRGSVRVLGLDPAAQGPALRRRTGVLTETPSLDDRLTARLTLRLFADIYGVPQDQVNRRVDDLLEMFDLTERAGDKLGTFSKGMRQRMALARTLLHDPEILFLDEPTAGLDPAATREVHQLIVRASRDERRTVFLCTHNLFEAQRLCDHVAVLAHGRLLAMGRPAELALRYAKSHRYLVEVEPAQVPLAVEQVQRIPGALAQPANGSADAQAHASGAIHVQGVPRPKVPDLLAALVAAGVAVYELIEEEGSLEEVYFALQEQAGGQ